MSDNVYFSVPADFNLDTLLLYHEGSEQLNYPIKEIYGALKTSEFGSGRPYQILPDCQSSDFDNYISQGKNWGIDFNYTLNSRCLGNNELTNEGKDRLLNFIDSLYSKGIRKMTVSLPTAVGLINKYFPDIKIYLSVMFGSDSLSKIRFVSETFNLYGIYLHESLYRNIPQLRQICSFCDEMQIETGILVNILCNTSCPFCSYHHCYSSHATSNNEASLPWYSYQCNLHRVKNPRFLLCGAWVRPEDLKIYIDLGIRKFKVSGREKLGKSPDFLRVVRAYNEGKYPGNLMELFASFVHNNHYELFQIQNDEKLDTYLKKVFAGELHCQECDNCGYCNDICANMVRHSEAQEEYVKQYTEALSSFMDLH